MNEAFVVTIRKTINRGFIVSASYGSDSYADTIKDAVDAASAALEADSYLGATKILRLALSEDGRYMSGWEPKQIQPDLPANNVVEVDSEDEVPS